MPTPQMNRRAFLATSAAASAAAFWPSMANAVPVQARRVEGPVRLGFIGLGNRGSEHLGFAVNNPSRCEVVALCDTALADSPVSGLSVDSDWQQVVHHPHVDAVVIATPDYLHAPMAMAALQAGKHVYVETPIAFSAAEADALAKRAQSSGAVLRAGAGHYHDWICIAGQTLVDHEQRKLNWVQTHFDLANSGSMLAEDAPDWRANNRKAGVFAAGGFCDAMYRITGILGGASPVRVSAAGGAYSPNRETPDSLVVRLEYASGTQAVLTSVPPRKGEAHMTLRFDSGTLAVADEWVEMDFPDRRYRKQHEVEHFASIASWLAHVQSGASGADYTVPVAIAHEMAARAYSERRTVLRAEITV